MTPGVPGPDFPRGVALEIVAAPAPAWVQDMGRPGHLVDGVPPGGALVPERLAGANRAVGNPAGAAAIEAFGGLTVAARGGDLRIAWGGDGGGAAWLPRDHVRVLAADAGARVAYLAVAGGLDVPVVLGGRGLLPVAGLGGGVGRPLRAGDRLAVGIVAGPGLTGEVRAGDDLAHDRPIRVVRGPDTARFSPNAWAALLAAPWSVAAASDRVGVRLVGPALGRVDGDLARSAPMVQGALQVPAGGAPIVLGPDHPTTGGYPVLGVAIRADLGALFLRPPGSPVQFVEVSLAEARRARAGWRAAWT